MGMINKGFVLVGVVMSLFAGASQAAVATGTAVISGSVAGPAAVCAVSGNSMTLGVINVGTQTQGVLSLVTNCSVNLPYSYNITSTSGGKLTSGTCSLNYSVVAYDSFKGSYGTANLLGLATATIIGSGTNQTNNFGVVVPAAQPGCTLAANSAASAVTDTLIVSVNY